MKNSNTKSIFLLGFILITAFCSLGYGDLEVVDNGTAKEKILSTVSSDKLLEDGFPSVPESTNVANNSEDLEIKPFNSSSTPAKKDFIKAKKLVSAVLANTITPTNFKKTIEALNAEVTYVTIVYLRAQEKISGSDGPEDSLLINNFINNSYSPHEIAYKLIGPDNQYMMGVRKFNTTYLQNENDFELLGTKEITTILDQTFFEEL